jgi:ribosomal-protein-alanine N-acetyltransferase
MIFRTWKYEDIKKIVELERASFATPWSYQMLFSAFSSPYFYGVLVEDGDEIVGYACETVLFETAETDIVAVDENYRRKGLGTKLLTELETQAKARGAERMLLEVRVSNEPAKSLYQKQGYKEVTVRKRYYPDGEDALIMQKNLTVEDE